MDNPDAYLLRGLGRELAGRGQTATFFEERRNLAARQLMQRSGSQIFADFQRHYPEIDYRSIELRSGVELGEWLVRLLATFDVALVTSEAPAELTRWIGRLTRSHLHTYLLDTGWGPALDTSEVEAREPGHYAAVLAGTDVAASRYGRYVEPERIHHIGPLPDPARLTELNEPEGSQLAAVAARTIEWIVARAQADEAARGSAPAS